MNPPKGYHKIKVHLVFAVMFDGRHKARLVVDGHLTPEQIEHIYSGVASLRNLRLVMFLGKLNNLDIWGADIGNAYLEASLMKSSTSLLAQNLRNLRDTF